VKLETVLWEGSGIQLMVNAKTQRSAKATGALTDQVAVRTAPGPDPYVLSS